QPDDRHDQPGCPRNRRPDLLPTICGPIGESLRQATATARARASAPARERGDARPSERQDFAAGPDPRRSPAPAALSGGSVSDVLGSTRVHVDAPASETAFGTASAGAFMP